MNMEPRDRTAEQSCIDNIVRRLRNQFWPGVGLVFAAGFVLFAEPQSRALSKIVQGPIREDQLTAPLRQVARKAGQRFLSPGKERSSVVGTIAHGGGSPVPVQIIRELPSQIRIEEASRPMLGASDSGPWKAGAAIETQDKDFLETVLSDSLEGFLVGQSEGFPTRFLGARFRADDGRTPSYKGPYHDLYQTFGSVRGLGWTNEPPKTYFINSDSLFLELIRYDVTSVGQKSEVMVRLLNWKKFGDEIIPTLVQRFENGTSAMTLTVTGATFSPKSKDGLFEKP